MAKPWILFDLDGTLNKKDEADKLKFKPTISITTFRELKRYYQAGIITNSKYFAQRYEQMQEQGFVLDGYVYRENETIPKKPDTAMYYMLSRQKAFESKDVMAYIGNDPEKDGKMAKTLGIEFHHKSKDDIEGFLRELIKKAKNTEISR